VVRRENILLGYLFSSLALRMGLDFDYELLMKHRTAFFEEAAGLPPEAVRGYFPAVRKYSNTHISAAQEELLAGLESG
jgi:hypothetical protein